MLKKIFKSRMYMHALGLKITAVFIIVTTVILLSPNLSAAEVPSPPKTEGVGAVYFCNITDDYELVAQNIDQKLNTSTTAKIMTGLLACEELYNRRNEYIEITESMISEASGNSMHLSVGEKVKINDLLYGAICGCCNDAAYAIANIVCPTTSDFVALMNSRAKKLGANSTSYTNPLGYPDNSAMTTTARDTMKIALGAYSNDLYMEISSAVKYSVSATNKSDERIIYNRNYLISSNTTSTYFNKKCRGINAGYTGEAGGWSLVTVGQDEGADYMCIILGGSESPDGSEIYAYKTANQLINWAVSSYDRKIVINQGDEVGMTSIRFTGLKTDNAPYIAATDLSIYAPKNIDLSNDIEYNIVMNQKTLDAPIEAGVCIGKLDIIYDGRVIGSCELLLKESYEKNSIVAGIQKITDYTHSRAFICSGVCFVILASVILPIMRYKFYKYDGRIRNKNKLKFK